jgi:hypothetical protein
MSRQPGSSRFRRLFGKGRSADLHRCPDCGRPFMCPREWETVGEEHWLIVSVCAECDARDERVVTNEEARRYDLELARQTAAIARQLQRIELERMRIECDAFVSALHHDLIDPADFSRY